MAHRPKRRGPKSKDAPKAEDAGRSDVAKLVDLLFAPSVEDEKAAAQNDNLKPCGLYARYSALSQSGSNADSAETQLSALRAAASGYGLRVVEEHSDEDETGVSSDNRAGFQRFMAGARKHRFSVAFLPDISRMGRTTTQLVNHIEELFDLGIEIHTLGAGKLTKATAMSMAVVAEATLGYLRFATAMAKRARAQKGLFVSKPPYGYEMDPEAKGRLLLVPEEVETIRYAVSRLLLGITPNQVCRDLNRRGALRRGGKLWTKATLVGTGRRPGICRNALIAGLLVYGRVTSTLSAKTGKRIDTPVPRERWTVVPVPDLAIVDAEEYHTLHGMLENRAMPASPRGPQRLLSGKLKCFSCGGTLVATGSAMRRSYARCRTAHMGGACNAYATVDREIVEVAILDRIQKLVGDGTFDKEAAAEYEWQLRGRDELATLDLRKAEKQLAEDKRQKDFVIEAVAKGKMPSGWGLEKMEALERKIVEGHARVDGLARGLALLEDDQLPIERVRHALSRIGDVLRARGPGADLPSEASEAVRALIDAVRVTPDADRSHLDVSGFAGFRTEIPRRGRGRPRKA